MITDVILIFIRSLLMSFIVMGYLGCGKTKKPNHVENANMQQTSLRDVPGFIRGKLIESENFSEGLDCIF